MNFFLPYFRTLVNLTVGLAILYFVVPYSYHVIDLIQKSEAVFEEIRKVGEEMNSREPGVSQKPSNIQILDDFIEYDSENISEDRKKVINTARRYIGTPYVWGGENPSGFDCSGFTQYVYNESLGFNIPRVSYEQYNTSSGLRVDRRSLEPGDLIFFITRGSRVSHVGIYIGDNKFIHAPSTGNLVRTERLNSYYYSSRFVGGKKFI